MNPEARRQLLLVACTLDRVALLARLRNKRAHPRALAAIQAAGPWLEAAAGMAMRLLPGKLRLVSKLVRLWRNR